MVRPSAFSPEGKGLDLQKVNNAVKDYAVWLHDTVDKLKSAEDVDYPLMRYDFNRMYNVNTCGFETRPDIEHPLIAYAQPTSFSIGYDYWKDATSKFFIEYPEAYKITGMSLKDIRELTVDEFLELKEIVEESYKLKLEFPDVQTRQLLEFRELAKAILEGLINANLINPPKQPRQAV